MNAVTKKLKVFTGEQGLSLAERLKTIKENNLFIKQISLLISILAVHDERSLLTYSICQALSYSEQCCFGVFYFVIVYMIMVLSNFIDEKHHVIRSMF